MNLGKYAKTVTALVAGGIGWATLVVNSAPAHITGPEWIGCATFLAVALGVYTAPNSPDGVAFDPTVHAYAGSQAKPKPSKAKVRKAVDPAP